MKAILEAKGHCVGPLGRPSPQENTRYGSGCDDGLQALKSAFLHDGEHNLRQRSVPPQDFGRIQRVQERVRPRKVNFADTIRDTPTDGFSITLEVNN